MKKLPIILALVALFCVILTAVSCGESATTTVGATETTAPTTTPVSLTTTAPVVTTTTPATTTPAPVTTTVPVSTGKPDPVANPNQKVLDPKTAFEAKVFEATNGLDLPYRIYIPEDYSEEYAYPVVVVLHGAGERGTDNTNQLNNLVPNLFIKKNSPLYQAIVICPQCPTDTQWVNTPWANGNYSVDRVPISKPLQATVELLDSLIDTYSINTNRQYVMGLSMGGFGTWDLLMRYPERFAAAIPFCGGADTSKAASLVNIPIHTFHDTTDGTVPCAGTQAMVEAIKAAGGKLIEYTETSRYGHDVWSPGSRSLALFNWLFEQRKG